MVTLSPASITCRFSSRVPMSFSMFGTISMLFFIQLGPSLLRPAQGHSSASLLQGHIFYSGNGRENRSPQRQGESKGGFLNLPPDQPKSAILAWNLQKPYSTMMPRKTRNVEKICALPNLCCKGAPLLLVLTNFARSWKTLTVQGILH